MTNRIVITKLITDDFERRMDRFDLSLRGKRLSKEELFVIQQTMTARLKQTFGLLYETTSASMIEKTLGATNPKKAR